MYLQSYTRVGWYQRHDRASQVYAVAELLQMDEWIGTFRIGDSTELKHVTALAKPALTKSALTNTFRSGDNLLLNIKKFFKIGIGGKRAHILGALGGLTQALKDSCMSLYTLSEGLMQESQ